MEDWCSPFHGALSCPRFCHLDSGYGDLVPSHTLSVIFTCVYALMGVAFLGMALGILGHQVIEKQEKAFRHAEAVCKYEVMTLFDGSSHGKSNPQEEHRTATLDSPTWIGKIRQRLLLEHVGDRIHVGRFLMLFSTLLALGGVIGYQEGWDAVDTIYYIIITGEQCIDIWLWQQPIRG
jgi:hypothetical protein